MPQPGGNCPICRELPTEVLTDLDLLMGDPSRWPDNVFDPFSPPKGELPASYRRHGAQKAGLQFLRAGGWDFTSAEVRRHYAYDTPKVAVTMNDLIQNGLIAANPSASSLAREAEAITLDPGAYLRFYAKGIDVGIKALQLLEKRVNLLIAQGKEVPIPLLKMMAEQGGKLAMSQAAIKAAGRQFGEGEDTDDLFRNAGKDEASQRVGHHRVRTVNGESRPVTDEGPGDRHDYAVRAAMDGSDPLPHP